jgi:hypothetical protein
LVGLAMAMAFSKLITFWPIQLFEVYRLRRAFHSDISAVGLSAPVLIVSAD